MEDSARIEINMYSFQIPSPTYIPTRFCGTNFCTSSACFALSFVRQPNGPECTQIVRNAPKRQFVFQRGGSGAFVFKNSNGEFVARTFVLVRPVLHRVS